MATLDMAITVERSYRTSMDSVARDVSSLGVTVERVLPAIGAIYGRADEACLPRLREVSGVERVRPTGTVRLAPFDPGIPQ